MSNAITLSPEAVQHAVDQAAHFNLYAEPDRAMRDIGISSGGAVVGMHIHQVLRRFQVIGRPPSRRTPLSGRSLVGEEVARLTSRWMVMPDGAVPRMDRDPAPTAVDSSRLQRFVMLDTTCQFANGDDGFRGFGTGMTMPFIGNGRPELLAMAVGTITEGIGRFRGHEEGTYVYCGRMSPQEGFTGNFLLRLMDRDETFDAGGVLPSIHGRDLAEPDVTYIVFRGQAVPADPVTPRVGADGRPNGLIVEQGLRLLELDAVGKGKPRATTQIGPRIGRITANVTFNPASPGGSVHDPIPFTAVDEFVFTDAESGQRVGSFTADSTEGRVFRTQVLGQPGIRFGGIGRIHEGKGVFEGIRGLMTDNSVVMFEPHVSASVYMLRIYDPDGRFSRRVRELDRDPPRWGGR